MITQWNVTEISAEITKSQKNKHRIQFNNSAQIKMGTKRLQHVSEMQTPNNQNPRTCIISIHHTEIIYTTGNNCSNCTNNKTRITSENTQPITPPTSFQKKWSFKLKKKKKTHHQNLNFMNESNIPKTNKKN